MLIVAREVACRRVRHRWRLRCEHLPAELNTIPDSLSRLSAVPAKPFPKEAAHAIQRTSPTWPQMFRARTLLSQDQCVSENSAKYQSQVSCTVGHWVCSHPSRKSVFSTMSVEFAPIWCFFAFCVLRLWFAPTRVSLRFLSRFCRVCSYLVFPCVAVQHDFGFAPTCVSWYFLGTFCRVCSYPSFRAFQCKATLSLVPPVSLCVVRAKSCAGFAPTRAMVRNGLLSPLSLFQINGINDICIY